MIVTNKAASVFAAIEKIAATPSTKDKENLVLQAVSTSPMFVRVVRAAYNLDTYGIAQIPHKTEGLAPGANTLDEDWPWQVLADMAARKLTGDAMRAKVQLTVDALDEASSALFRRILGKDLRAGFTDGTVDRCVPGTIAAKPAYMRSVLPKKSKVLEWDWSKGHFSQEKHDGLFLNMNRNAGGGTPWVQSRAGSVYPMDGLAQLLEQAEQVFPPNTQTHGEGLIVQDGVVMSRADGNGVWNALLAGGTLAPNQKAIFVAWDQIPLSAATPKGTYELEYEQRFASLVRQIKAARDVGIVDIQLTPTRIVKSYAEARQHAREVMAKGGEGAMVKHRKMQWKDTKGGNPHQVKIKLEAQFELIMNSLVAGAAGKKHEHTFGAVRCHSACKQLWVDVPGYTDAKRQAIFEDFETRFKGKVMTVKGNAITEPSASNPDYSIFLPGHVEIREDKTEADSLDEIRAIFEAAVEAA
jgi:DNA ligase-1